LSTVASGFSTNIELSRPAVMAACAEQAAQPRGLSLQAKDAQP
jgi:hypothetical protein